MSDVQGTPAAAGVHGTARPVYALFGFLLALVFAAVTITVGIALILVKQRKGLYSKKIGRGLYVFVCRERL